MPQVAAGCSGPALAKVAPWRDEDSDMTTPPQQISFERAAEMADRRRRKHASLHNRFRLWVRRARNQSLRWLYWLPATWLVRRGWRFPVISNPNRIGHLVIEPDYYLRKAELDGVDPGRPVLLASPKRVANRAFVEVLRQKYTVVEEAWARALLSPFSYDPRLRVDLALAVGTDPRIPNFQAVMTKWGDRGTIWSLPQQMEKDGRAALAEMGVPKDAWFVCVHSREGGYSPADEHLHAHRNSDIASYSLAIERITERGGWCIRVGDPSMQPIPDLPRAIDYARSSWKSDWMDVFLGARCRFFLGNTSGLCALSSAFDVPSVLVNMVPLAACYGSHPSDIAVPKLHRKGSERLRFEDIFTSEIADFRETEQYHSAELDVIDNTPDEIADAVIEMLDRLEGVPPDLTDAARQADFRRSMRPEHYTYGAGGKISAAFLSKHRDLLSSQNAGS